MLHGNRPSWASVVEALVCVPCHTMHRQLLLYHCVFLWPGFRLSCTSSPGNIEMFNSSVHPSDIIHINALYLTSFFHRRLFPICWTIFYSIFSWVLCLLLTELVFYQHPPPHASSWMTVYSIWRSRFALRPPSFSDSIEVVAVLFVPSTQIRCWIPWDIMPLHVSVVGMWYFATTSWETYWLKHVGKPILVFKWKLVATSLSWRGMWAEWP